MMTDDSGLGPAGDYVSVEYMLSKKWLDAVNELRDNLRVLIVLHGTAANKNALAVLVKCMHDLRDALRRNTDLLRARDKPQKSMPDLFGRGETD
jgi:hypothetical protein